MKKKRAAEKLQGYLLPILIAFGILAIAYGLISSSKPHTNDLTPNSTAQSINSLATGALAPNEINNGAITPGQVYNNTYSSLFPSNGFKTQIVLGNVIPELVASGALNLSKVKALYGNNLTQEELNLLTKPNYTYLTLTPQKANFLLLVLWPLGIANKNPILDNFSANAGTDVANLASTGGWTLGTKDAMTYFDKLQLVNLTPEQQANVQYVAMHTYRPCCSNPTGFPDCNHGAALLALTELGASQGLNRTELFTLALDAQTLWFPTQYYYTAIALHYSNSSNKGYWNNSQTVLGANYSTSSGWYQNVYKPLNQSRLLPPSRAGGASCGV